jgi:hypothetical protein
MKGVYLAYYKKQTFAFVGADSQLKPAIERKLHLVVATDMELVRACELYIGFKNV